MFQYVLLGGLEEGGINSRTSYYLKYDNNKEDPNLR